VIGLVLNISTEPEPGTTIAEGITVGKIEVFVQPAYSFVNPRPDVTVKPGDPSMSVYGSLTNTSSTGLQVSFFSTGFNANGKEVAWTLDAGPIMGVLAMTIQAGSTRYFTLHLNWTPETTLVRVSAHSYTTLVPIP
jgi:hypothetical protein